MNAPDRSAQVVGMNSLAVALFEAYARNSGHDPNEHFDRSAAEQWMAQALEEVGVADLVKSARPVALMPLEDFAHYDNAPDSRRIFAANDWSLTTGDIRRLRRALVRIGGAL